MKILGATILFLALTLLGGSLGRRVRRGENECAAFLDFIRFARSKICALDAPTKEIYRGYENETLRGCGFLYALKKAEAESVYFDAFTRAFDEISASLSLDGEAKTIIRSFGDIIGKSAQNEQLRLIDDVILRLEEKHKKLNDAAKRDAKMYQTLGFSLGAIIFILLL